MLNYLWELLAKCSRMAPMIMLVIDNACDDNKRRSFSFQPKIKEAIIVGACVWFQ